MPIKIGNWKSKGSYYVQRSVTQLSFVWNIFKTYADKKLGNICCNDNSIICT